MRYSADVAEINSQKQSLKSQVDEYEQKIKSLILDLEAQSKKHIKSTNELNEQYMNFKSSAAEMKSKISIYKSDQEAAIQGEREAKKEVLRLTFLNDEFLEKIHYLESKFQSLAKHVNASKEDLEAVEN